MIHSFLNSILSFLLCFIWIMCSTKLKGNRHEVDNYDKKKKEQKQYEITNYEQKKKKELKTQIEY